MAKAQIYNDATGQYEDDPNAPPDPATYFSPVTNGKQTFTNQSAGNANAAAAAGNPVNLPLNPAPVQSAPAAPTAPSGGNLSDPAYAKQFVDYYGTQPGVNPSVKSDPNYWVSRFTSGAFGNDQAYAISRMMQAEGAPEGASAAPAAAAAPAAPAVDPYQAQLRSALMQKIQEFSAPVTGSDPAVAAVNQTYDAGVGRAAQAQRAQSAERAAFEGLNSGGQGSGSFDTELNGITEQAGQDMASHDSGVVLQQIQQRQALLQSFLQMAVQSGDTQSAQALQLQIAQMDDQIRQQQLTQSGSQFNAQLGQQQSQFNDTLGFNEYQYSNDDALRKALITLTGGA